MSKITGEIPREKLKELVQRTGETLLQDPDRCEGLLKDHCGSHRKEISALVGALEERVPLELKSSWQSAIRRKPCAPALCNDWKRIAAWRPTWPPGP